MKEETNRSRISLGLKCGDCLHHTVGPKVFEKLCSQLGKTLNANACQSFSPNVFKLTFVKQGSIDLLAQLTSELSREQTRLLAFTLASNDYIKKAGFEFGQVVYFSINHEGNLDSYFSAVVIGASAKGDMVHLSSTFEKLQTKAALLSLESNTVLNQEKFNAKRRSLIKQNKIYTVVNVRERKTALDFLYMTKTQIHIYKKQLETGPVDYIPPSIDTVPTNWLDSRVLKTLKPSIKKTTGKVTENGLSITRQIAKNKNSENLVSKRKSTRNKQAS